MADRLYCLLVALLVLAGLWWDWRRSRAGIADASGSEPGPGGRADEPPARGRFTEGTKRASGAVAHDVTAVADGLHRSAGDPVPESDGGAGSTRDREAEWAATVAFLDRVEAAGGPADEREKQRLRELLQHPSPVIEERVFGLLGHDPLELSFLIAHVRAREDAILELLEENRTSVRRVGAYDRFFRTRNLRLLARISGPAPAASPLLTEWHLQPEIARRLLESQLAAEFEGEPGNLIRRGRLEVLPRLLSIADDAGSDPVLRSAAVLGLAEVAEVPDLAPVRRLLGSDLPLIRYCAVDVLGNLAGAEATADLLGALGDPSPHVRIAAIDHLARLGVSAAIPSLCRLLDAEPQYLAHAARQALTRMPDRPEVCRQLLDGLERFLTGQAAVACELLAELGCQAAMPRIRAALDDPRPEVRISAANALLIMRDHENLPRIMALAGDLSDEALALAEEIERGMGRTGTPCSLEDYLTERLTQTDDPDLQYYAVQLLMTELAARPRPAPPPALIEAAAGGNVFVRGAALLALSSFGDEASLRVLTAALQATDEYVRVCAVTAWWRRRPAGLHARLRRLILEDPAEEVVMTALICLYREADREAVATVAELAPRLHGPAALFAHRMLAGAPVSVDRQIEGR